MVRSYISPDLFGGLPATTFGTIAADPPWSFKTWSDKGKGRSPDYALMSLDDIKALPVADLALPDSVLLLWVVNPMLPQGLDVMSAWGFSFKTIAFCWAKTTLRTDVSWAPKYHIGLGYWSRQNIELCLLGVRGKPKRQARDVRQLIVSPRRDHSRKPEQFYSSAERLAPGPYLELFSRTNREGWVAWGNESGKFNQEKNDNGESRKARESRDQGQAETAGRQEG